MKLSIVLAAFALAACSSGTAGPAATSASQPATQTTAPSSATAPASPSTSASSTSAAPSSSAPTSAAAGSAAQKALARMTLRERVGQLIMIDSPSTGAGQATRTAITQYHVGSVILDGTTTSGLAAVQGVTSELRSLAPRGVGLFISTDQEGGLVQRLKGSGFDRIPSGVDQGRIAPSTLQRDAATWGSQLLRAGVNVNLSPVLDTVPAGSGPNPPIGDLDRQYGSTPGAVTSHGLAFVRGMTSAGVDVTVKHFPGLGRVTGNTDTTAGVTDTVTTRNDAYLAPFRAVVRAGVPFVMMSTAIYSRIDRANPAAFSKTIVTGMLRGDLGFRGIVISDDLGAAAQVSGTPLGQRAVRFIAAGGDMVLSVVPSQAATLTGALVAKAQADPSFAKLVNAAALRVLQGKQARGLLR